MNQRYFAVDSPSENRLNVVVITSARDDHRLVTNPTKNSSFSSYLNIQLLTNASFEPAKCSFICAEVCSD